MNETMKAIAITGERQIKIIDLPKPVPKENEILIRIKAAALCTVEQRAYTGEKKVDMPYVGGHEIAGIIEEIGANVPSEQFKIGQHCTGRIQPYCGTCYHCKRGEYEQCEIVADNRYNGPDYYGLGGLAQYVCINKSLVWLYNDDIPFAEASLTEPLTCVLNSLDHARLLMGDDALIIGGGVMGQMHITLLNKKGVRTILSEPDETRRKFALEHGCSIVIDPTKEDLEKRIKELTNGQGVETVFNTTAIPSVAQSTLKLVASMGTIVTYSSQHPDKPIEVSPGWLHSTEVNLTGVVHPPVQCFTKANNLINKKIICMKDFVSKTYPLEQANEAFKAALSKDTYRVVIEL